MGQIKKWGVDLRQRLVPDVVAAESKRQHKQIRLHQFAGGAGIEIGVWRMMTPDVWERYAEPIKLKRWESVALIRALMAVMKDRESRKVHELPERD